MNEGKEKMSIKIRRWRKNFLIPVNKGKRLDPKALQSH